MFTFLLCLVALAIPVFMVWNLCRDRSAEAYEAEVTLRQLKMQRAIHDSAVNEEALRRVIKEQDKRGW